MRRWQTQMKTLPLLELDVIFLEVRMLLHRSHGDIMGIMLVAERQHDADHKLYYNCVTLLFKVRDLTISGKFCWKARTVL